MQDYCQNDLKILQNLDGSNFHWRDWIAPLSVMYSRKLHEML